MRTLLSILLLLSLTTGPAGAATQPAGDPAADRNGPIRVAVKPAEPFVIESDDGFEGISIELWERVAERVGIEYEYVRTDLDGLLGSVESGEAGAGVGAITVTSEREERLDFTHPFYTGGLAIAVNSEAGGLRVMSMLGRLISPGFLTAVVSLAVLLAGVGLLVWLVERRANPEQFGGNPIKGLGSGFWFSAVTMTTVGYGDKAPISPLGRVVTLVWMFVSVIIISFFTGAIASAFTATSIEGNVRGPSDLPRVRVGAIEGSAGSDALSDRGVRTGRYADVQAGLDAVASGAVDAFVHDEAILKYQVGRETERKLRVLEATFERQPYAIALPPSSPLREEINLAILEVLASNDWSRVVARYIDGD